jgi:two-component system, NtrC family, response regulator HydG
MKRILIVDDDVAVTNYLMVALMQTDLFEVQVINRSRIVVETVEREPPDIMLLDMDMPDVSGMDILASMSSRGLDIPVVILTGVPDVELAVKAMKRGAFDYLVKPVEDEHLVEVLKTVMEKHALNRSIKQLPSELSREDLVDPAAFDHVPTQDPAMIRVLHQAERMALSDMCIFIWGERGTGKEGLARAIHKASSRSDQHCVAVDVAAADPERFPADLFGQAQRWGDREGERPGFLEQAAGGTLFLDNIARLSLPMQVRLRRVLQEGEYYREDSTVIVESSARFIVSTTRNLTHKKYKGRFDRDLLYHLMINSLLIPPLRERRGDIPLLAEHFLTRYSKRFGRKVGGFHQSFLDSLAAYDFPDNVQELRSIVKASLATTDDGQQITVEALPMWIRSRLEGEGTDVLEGPEPLLNVQREHVQHALNYYGGDRERTARELGIERRALDELLV